MSAARWLGWILVGILGTTAAADPEPRAIRVGTSGDYAPSSSSTTSVSQPEPRLTMRNLVMFFGAILKPLAVAERMGTLSNSSCMWLVPDMR